VESNKRGTPLGTYVLLNLLKGNYSSLVLIPGLEEYLCTDVGTGIQSNEKHVRVWTFYNDI
jgi:hypothetical protein